MKLVGIAWMEKSNAWRGPMKIAIKASSRLLAALFTPWRSQIILEESNRALHGLNKGR